MRQSACTISSLLASVLGLSATYAGPHSGPTQASDVLEIQSVAINGKSISLAGKAKVTSSPSPQNIAFTFGQPTNATRSPIRVRYKLEGYDNTWHEGGGEMFVMVRFYNESGDAIGAKSFSVNGDSAGWSGELKTSTFTHRRETVVVPNKASNFWIVMSSAGPPQTVGIYVMDHLVVSKLADSGATTLLLQAAFDQATKFDPTNQVPLGWTRDGIHPSMAKIIDLEPDRMTKALAILDDDPESHAEWHTIRE